MMKILIVCLWLMVFSATAVAINLERTDTGFVYPIGIKNFNPACGLWLGRDGNHGGGCYNSGFYHIGTDMMTNSMSAFAYAIADGSIYYRDCMSGSWGPGNCALFIKHQTSDGKVFTALYGLDYLQDLYYILK